MDYYDKYIDALSTEHGVWAFLKWFFLGVIIQIVGMAPGMLAFVLVAVLPKETAGPAASIAFLAVFFVVRYFLFAVPSARAAGRKGLGSAWVWGGGAFIFGPFVLALVAALSPKSAIDGQIGQ